jgi:rubrerythrin
MANTTKENKEKVKEIFKKAEEVEIKAPDMAEAISIATDSEKFVCEYCGKICTSSSGLTLHKNRCKKAPKN